MKELNNMNEQVKTPSQDLSTQSAEPTTPQPGSKRPLIIAVGIVLVLLVLVGGYLLFNQNNTNSKIASIKSFEECEKAGYPVLQSDPEQCGAPGGKMFYGAGATETVAQPSPISNPTANWKTYSSTRLEVSLKYPSSWNLSEAKDFKYLSISNYPYDKYFHPASAQQPYEKGDYKLDITDYEYQGYKSSNALMKFFNTEKDDHGNYYHEQIFYNYLTMRDEMKKNLYTLKNQKVLNINGYDSLYREENNIPVVYILDGSGKSIKVEGDHFAGHIDDKFMQILSTFKFSGQNQTLDTANWKTYTSSEEGLSFKYPPEYKLSAIYDEYTKSTPVTIKGPNNFGFSYSVTNNRTAFYPGYISHTREVNISGHKLYVSYVGRDSGKKVSYIELHENKYDSGFLGDILLDYASRKNQDKWVSFGGSYSSPEQETSENFDPNEFANKPEVKIAEKIFSTLTYEK